jgi:heat shock protein HtpX
MRRLQRGDSALLWFMIAADVAAAAAVFLLGPGPSALIRTAELALPVLFGIAASDFGGRMGGIPKGMTPLGEDERPELHRLVNDLSDKASLPRPQILLDAAPGVNAAGARMAGRDIVAFTPDLLKALRPAEVAAVAGHELTHIRHGDMALYTALPYFLIAAMVVHSTLFGSFAAGAAAVAAHWVLATRVLRDREFLADLGSASLAGSPEGVAGTLIHLDLWARMIPGRAWAPVAPPALSDALSSHPSSSRRISAILGLLGRAPKAPRARLWPFGKSVKSAAERFSAFLENPDAFIRRRAALSMRRLAFRTQSPDILRAASLAVSAALLKEEDAALRASLSGLLARLQARARAVKG